MKWTRELKELQFDEFWKEYPRKSAKKNAERAFMKIKMDDETATKIMKALLVFKNCEQWQQENGKYIPYPATWLNQKRWEDEIAQKAQERNFDVQEAWENAVKRSIGT